MIYLSRASVWLPEGFESGEFISEQSGIPVHIVKEKMGIQKKCRATADEHPSMMAIEASKHVLKGIDPLSVDLVIWTGSEYKDYNVWSAGIFVQRELGLKKAHAFDIAARCSTNVVGLRVAKAMMTAHPEIKRVLLCGGHKTGDLVNYKDENSRFLYNLSDGGSAMLVEHESILSNPQASEILSSSVMTDGDFSLDVIIPAGGTKKPAHSNPSKEDCCLQVPDMAGMRDRLAERSIENFLHVIREAAKNSMSKPIDYLALLHMKKSAHDAILEPLELKEEQSVYLDQYGHFGAPDQVLSVGLAEKQKKLKEGDHVVLASAGIGYTWSAISLKWRGDVFVQDSLKV